MTSASVDDPVTTSTVVGEEPCDGSDAVAEEHDVCTWTMTTTTSEEAPPRLELRLNTATGGDEFADGALVVWSAGDCVFFLDHDSGMGAEEVLGSGTALVVGCGESTTECIGVAGNTAHCETTYEDESHIGLERGVREGRDLVWALTFEHELAEWAPLHARGRVLRPGTAAVGPRLPEGGTLAAFTCGTDTPCLDVVGDYISGQRDHTVG